jgi:hypothetical protein
MSLRETDDGASVERTSFLYRPGEAAVAVRVEDTFESTSTESLNSALWLFRRVGGRLEPVFHADVTDVTTDKQSGRVEPDDRWVVRFDTHLTLGAYDLILARKGHRAGQRYVWSGSRYVDAVPDRR